METTNQYNKLLNSDIKEGFVPIQTNILIKTILFSLVFYIISNTLIFNYLKLKLPRNIDINLIQTLIFALLFYIINVNL
jgi:hypothetical protein